MSDPKEVEELRDIATIVAGISRRLDVAIIMSDDQPIIVRTNIEQALTAISHTKKRLEDWLCQIK